MLCKKKIAESAKIRKIDEIGEIPPYFAKSVKIAKLLKLQLKLQLKLAAKTAKTAVKTAMSKIDDFPLLKLLKMLKLLKLF